MDELSQYSNQPPIAHMKMRHPATDFAGSMPSACMASGHAEATDALFDLPHALRR
jgi:hypothetical protein